VSTPPAPLRLAVSLHDVAPQTWPACERLLAAVAAIADIPITLLVAPDYHGAGLRGFTAAYRSALDARLARGDELALHGWAHLDRHPLRLELLDTLRRTQLTAREGEFAALPAALAAELLERGVEWFASHGWPLHGFVAPAWLMSAGTWEALAKLPLQYTTTLGHLYLLPERAPIETSTYVYSARTRWRRRVSLMRNAVLLKTARNVATVRVALHPADAAHPQLMRHCQSVLRCLTGERLALTKAQLAQQLRAERAAARAVE
jgi:predicted deacetylase